MKSIALAALALLAVSGCASRYDLTAVCLTPEGKPVSEGGVYQGKTCSRSHMVIDDGKSAPLVWR